LDKVADRAPIDLGKLPDAAKQLLKLDADATLLRAYYYHCPVFVSQPPTLEQRERQAKQDRYFEAIRRLPRYEVRLGRLAYRGIDAQGKPIFQQKRADVLLAIDFVLLSVRKDISEAILLAGDGDFVPIVKVAKDAGVVVHLLHSHDQFSKDLWSECDSRAVVDKALLDTIKRK
jgi:uncharacterized LabA/DUF88 family protein